MKYYESVLNKLEEGDVIYLIKIEVWKFLSEENRESEKLLDLLKNKINELVVNKKDFYILKLLKEILLPDKASSLFDEINSDILNVLNLGDLKLEDDILNELKKIYTDNEEVLEILYRKELSKNILDTFEMNYSWEEWWKYKNTILEMLEDLIAVNGEKEIIGIAKNIFDSLSEELNLGNLNRLDVDSPENAVLLTEAVNWASKKISKLFYALKPAMIYSSWLIGAELGVVKDVDDDKKGDIYYLQAPGLGVASFHDPRGGVKSINDFMSRDIPDWTYGWSGVTRDGIKLLRMMVQIENDEELETKDKIHFLKKAIGTTPGNSLKEKTEKLRIDFMKKRLEEINILLTSMGKDELIVEEDHFLDLDGNVWYFNDPETRYAVKDVYELVKSMDEI